MPGRRKTPAAPSQMLPDGRTTTSDEVYVNDWRNFGRPIAAMFGGVLSAWDPGITIHIDGRADLQLDIETARRLSFLAAKVKEQDETIVALHAGRAKRAQIEARGEEAYYLQDKRTFVGNSVMWWCPDGHGYTTHIDKAGVFSKEEALSIARGRGTDVPWRCADVDQIWAQHIDMQYLHDFQPLKVKP